MPFRVFHGAIRDKNKNKSYFGNTHAFFTQKTVRFSSVKSWISKNSAVHFVTVRYRTVRYDKILIVLDLKYFFNTRNQVKNSFSEIENRNLGLECSCQASKNGKKNFFSQNFFFRKICLVSKKLQFFQNSFVSPQKNLFYYEIF